MPDFSGSVPGDIGNQSLPFRAPFSSNPSSTKCSSYIIRAGRCLIAIDHFDDSRRLWSMAAKMGVSVTYCHTTTPNHSPTYPNGCARYVSARRLTFLQPEDPEVQRLNLVTYMRWEEYALASLPETNPRCDPNIHP
jgi:hypothetical protein